MAFTKGNSGNPKGRVKGADSKIKSLRVGLIEHIPAILETLASQAKLGDMTACKLILERVLPPLKSHSSSIKIPAADTLAEQGGEIIKATIAGQLPPDVGAQLITALANQSRIVETDELIKRIEALDAAK